MHCIGCKRLLTTYRCFNNNCIPFLTEDIPFGNAELLISQILPFMECVNYKRQYYNAYGKLFLNMFLIVAVN